MALYGLTLKCKENKQTKNKYAVSEDYPSNILTTQASGVEKNGRRTVKMFKENHHHKNTK